jgi:prolyl oligopeptidase
MSSPTPWNPQQTPYPAVRRSDTVEEFKSAKQGTVKVADPYDWLSFPDSPETQQFVKEQGDFTKKYLDQYKDKDKFSKELEKNWNYARCEFSSSRLPTSPATLSPLLVVT